MSYNHPGDAWTDVESPTLRLVYCDRCAVEQRAEINARCEDDEAQGMNYLARMVGPWRVLVGYYFPDPDDKCDGCGVVARLQHTEEEA